MRFIVVFVLTFLLCVSASAKDEPAPPPAPPSQPLNALQAAVKVDEAIAAKDTAALNDLAAQERPDPWVVVYELCRHGKHDEALAFAEAGQRPATERLPEYVRARREMKIDEDLHKVVIATTRAIQEKKPAEGIAALPASRLATDTVLGIILRHAEARLRQIQGRTGTAASLYAETGEGAEAIGWLHRAGMAFAYAGRYRGALGEEEAAFAYLERSLEAWKSIGFDVGAGSSLIEMASIARRADRHLEAARYYERALRLMRKAGHAFGVTAVLFELASEYNSVGDYARSLEHYERVLPLYKKLNKRSKWAAVRINMGNVESSLANYSRAIEHYEAGIAEAQSVGDDETTANGLLNLAGVYWQVGNSSRALVLAERALERMRSGGRADGAARALSGLGTLRMELGDAEGALELFQSALSQAEVLEVKDLQVASLSNLGRVYFARREFELSAEYYERARALAEAIGDRELHARTTASLGMLRARQGRLQEGLALLEEAERAARRLRARATLVWCLSQLATLRLGAGEAERAMHLSREARTEVAHLLGGLGPEHAATLRERYFDLFGTGALAAARAGDTAEVLAFLESGRAGALLELLGGRHAMRWSDVPEGLRRTEARAKTQEAAARRAYRIASAAGEMKTVRTAARRLDEAQALLGEVMEKIQRGASPRTRALFYPRAAPLEELQGVLEDDQALVVYGLAQGTALALVVTPKGARVVELGPVADALQAVEAFDASDVSVDPAPHVASLRTLLVKPLGLSKKATQLLVSPAGSLAYLPFSLLFDRPIAMTPSGTTHAFLKGDVVSPGAGVLALGSPEYGDIQPGAKVAHVRGEGLAPLPSSGPEATAVGDTVLLGADASEAGLREALAKKERWRSVHFACHGRVDREFPLLSSLALSRSEGEDGFLTAAEVLRMEIPADLAVLSACETGKGKLVWGEGIVGLTRAFMYAGAPRVLCSLWKVDDAATMELMTKFYELWGSKAAPGASKRKRARGLGAAAALKQAQAYVRDHPDHPEWKHPYYWAAWVLWGLPD